MIRHRSPIGGSERPKTRLGRSGSITKAVERRASRRRRRGVGSTAAIAFVALSIGLLAAPFVRSEEITYEDHVLPVLRNHCLSCHNSDRKEAGLDLSVYRALLEADVVTSRDLDDSILYQLVLQAEEPRMPPNQPRIPDESIEVLRKWIESGLIERSGAKAVAGRKSEVVALAEAPTGRPAGPPCLPEETSIEPSLLLERAGTVRAMATAPWAPLVAIGTTGQICLYHLEERELDGSARLLAVLPFPEGAPMALRFSRSGTLLVAGGGRGGHSGRAVVWDVRTGRRVQEVGDELDAVLAVDISPDQREIALGGAGKKVEIYSTETGDLLDSLTKHAEWVTAIEYSPDGVLLASADRGGGLYVWESQSRQLFHDLRGHDGEIPAITWRSDSNVLASVGSDGGAQLWNMETGRSSKRWKAHDAGATCIAFGPNGRLVTAGRDQTVKSWKGDGKGIRVFLGLGDIATAARFDSTGKRVLAGDFLGGVKIFDDGSGETVAGIETAIRPLEERIAAARARVDELAPRYHEAQEAHAAVEAAQAGAEIRRSEAIERERRAVVALESAVARRERTGALVEATRQLVRATEAIAGDPEFGEAAAALLETYRARLAQVEGWGASAIAGHDAAEAEWKAAQSERRVAEKAAAEAAVELAQSEAQHAEIRSRWRSARTEQHRLECAVILERRLARAAEVEDAQQAATPALAGEAEARDRVRAAEVRIAALEAELETQPVRFEEGEAEIARALVSVEGARAELGALAEVAADRAERIDDARRLLATLTPTADGEPESAPIHEAIRHCEACIDALTRHHSEAQAELDAQLELISEKERSRQAAREALVRVSARTDALPGLIELERTSLDEAREAAQRATQHADEQRRRIAAAQALLEACEREYRAARARAAEFE